MMDSSKKSVFSKATIERVSIIEDSDKKKKENLNKTISKIVEPKAREDSLDKINEEN